MAKSVMHDRIEVIARDRGAMCLSAELIRATVLDSLIRAISFGTDAQVLFPTGHDAVIGKFNAISLNPSRLTAKLEEGADGLVVRVGPDFVVMLELQTTAEAPISFCTIRLDVRDVVLPLEGDGHLIHIRAASSPVLAQVIPSSTRDAAIAASGISPEDLLRVEGSIAYVASSRLVSSALGEVPPLDLKRLFPALSFEGELKLHLVDDSLLIIPERFALIGNPGCPKGDAMADVKITPRDPVKADKGMTWTHDVVLRPISDRYCSLSNALVSTYLPKPVLDLHFGKAMPAIAFRESGGGFIGYDVKITAAIRGAKVSIDPAVSGLRLKLDFETWGNATANIDVPCVGRMDLARAEFRMPINSNGAEIEVLLRPAVDAAKRLIVVCELARLDLGEAQVDVRLIQRYLGLAGGESAVIGFIIDTVIGRVLAHNLPGLAFDVIRDAINQHFFVLVDLGGFVKYLRIEPFDPMFSGDARSALIGASYRG